MSRKISHVEASPGRLSLCFCGRGSSPNVPEPLFLKLPLRVANRADRRSPTARSNHDATQRVGRFVVPHPRNHIGDLPNRPTSVDAGRHASNRLTGKPAWDSQRAPGPRHKSIQERQFPGNRVFGHHGHRGLLIEILQSLPNRLRSGPTETTIATARPLSRIARWHSI
jgi:hypothetical protein